MFIMTQMNFFTNIMFTVNDKLFGFIYDDII